MTFAAIRPFSRGAVVHFLGSSVDQFKMKAVLFKKTLL
jgi:hypothetical protein